MRLLVRSVMGAALPLMMVAGVWAQQQPSPVPQSSQSAPGYTLKVQSQIVVLDVVVTDKKGANVHHLTADDFTVLEDKAPQKIKSFEEFEPPAPAAVIPVDSTEELDKLEPQAPVTILVLDELTTQFADIAFTRYSLKKYLNAQGEVLQQPTMLVSANFKNIAVLHDYTTSRKEILDAIDHHLESIDSIVRPQNSSWGTEEMNGAFQALIGVAEATAGHPGHKNMIWVGRGFPTIDPSTLVDEDNEELQHSIASCANLLRDARVTLYSIDPAGLQAAPPVQDMDGDEPDPFGGQVDFEAMVTATGGRALHGRNDVDAQIDESVRDGENFYTLSYTPTTPSDDPKPFRNIHVVMKDRSLTATTREGYFAHADPVAPVRDAKGKFTTRVVFDLTAATTSWLVYDGVPLTVTRDAKAPDTFTLHMKGGSFQVQGDVAPGKPNAELTVVLESFDRKGKLLNRNTHLVSLHVSAEDEPVNLLEKIPTQAPAARVRLVVRDNASGKIGAENVFLIDRKQIDDPATGVGKHNYK